jgi:hypothetical protein
MFEKIKKIWIKIRTKRLGMVMLVFAAVLGFVWPAGAKWILLIIVLIGLISWLTENKE